VFQGSPPRSPEEELITHAATTLPSAPMPLAAPCPTELLAWGIAVSPLTSPLDAHVAQLATTFTPARSDNLFARWGVDGLRQALDTTVGKGNWAFTGSFAQWLWAWHLRGTARRPGDIDLVAESDGSVDDSFYKVWGVIAGFGFEQPGTPKSPKATLLRFEHGNGAKIDLMKDSDSHAPPWSQLTTLGDVVLPSLEALIERKREILDGPYGLLDKAKAKADILNLEELIRLRDG
jgi:hypothetical protein